MAHSRRHSTAAAAAAHLQHLPAPFHACLQGAMHYFGAAFLMWELSTPLMYVR